MHVIPFKQLSTADLHIDRIYQGKRHGNAGDDPLHRLLGVSNQGGFRILGSREYPRLVVLTTSMSDPEWPDNLDIETGVFTYYGDNKRPGRELHETPRFGNALLRNMFNAVHTQKREYVAPVLIFSSTGQYRDMIFRGLAVPGRIGIPTPDDLVAIWKITGGERFQNYQAKFTVLDVPRLSRQWLDALRTNGNLLEDAPASWQEWRATGLSRPLKAVQSLEIRTKKEQLPSGNDTSLLDVIMCRYSASPHDFEGCAAEIIRLFLGENVVSIDLTRPVRDGGRDAIGRYLIGSSASSIAVVFSMEAKCYNPSNSVGVRDLSRLISRLRHRQFGILVTTSWVNRQAYKEIKADDHPVIIISGGDIVSILKQKGIASKSALNEWLDRIVELSHVGSD